VNRSTEAVRPDAPASLLGLALPSSAGSPYVRIGFHWPVANRGRQTHSHGLQRRCVTDAVSCHGGSVAVTCEGIDDRSLRSGPIRAYPCCLRHAESSSSSSMASIARSTGAASPA